LTRLPAAGAARPSDFGLRIGGCGKSLFAAEFLVRGVTEFKEPGVLMTFEETADDIRKNVASLGFDVDRLVAQKKLVIDYVHVDRSEIDENGEYDLEGLFIRLGHAVDTIGAKRVVLDTIETLFSGFHEPGDPSLGMRRLFGWLKERNLTTVSPASAAKVTDEARPGRIRLRLRDLARSSRTRPDFDAAASGGEVSRVDARNERVSVPDRRAGDSRSCPSPRVAWITR
jgi:KaiC/GvpD/RAD55 family RecA-like ATPase